VEVSCKPGLNHCVLKVSVRKEEYNQGFRGLIQANESFMTTMMYQLDVELVTIEATRERLVGIYCGNNVLTSL
jgi:hypothetical protein